MTSDQEEVCGTCGGDPRDGNGYHAYDCPERTGRTPAPVVPSDDAPRREQYATSDEYRAAMVEWALSAPPTPSQDARVICDHKFMDHGADDRCKVADCPCEGWSAHRGHPQTLKQQARRRGYYGPVVECLGCHTALKRVEGRYEHVIEASGDWSVTSFCQPRPATEPPSQDAEGDEREEAWARYDEWMRSGTYRSGMARKMRAAIESSIRADYEELVKAAQRIKAARTFDLGWRGEGAPPRCIEVPASDWDEFIAALTRIEESHQ